MKKFLFAVIATCFLVSCGYKSVETPINDYLVTYTVKDSELVGIKQPGKKGALITPADFVKVQEIDSYGRLLCQLPGLPETYRLINSRGEEIIEGILTNYEHYERYRTFCSDQGMHFLRAGHLVGPKDDFYFSYKNNMLFSEKAGKWGVEGVLKEEFERIIVLYEAGTQNHVILGMTSGQPAVRATATTRAKPAVPAKWEVFDDKGLIIKNTTAAAVARAETTGKSERYASERDGLPDGTISLYDVQTLREFR